ncbi:MAG: TolC family outer membrane protein [Novosphingobium sp.]|nr:TolC family outer membrane protein [Novosphingobium sp.]
MAATRRRIAVLTGAALAAAPALSPLRADDLRDALLTAYNTNPTLQGARASQRATDEQVPIERAAGLPNASAAATHTEILKDSSAGNTVGAASFGPSRQLSGSVSLGVPIYSGGAVKNAVRAAETRVQAGQASLRGTESSVFSQVVAAYMDVILDQAVVGLNRGNVQVLEVNLRATRDRFEIGELTRTDVAQSESRLAIARSDTQTAESNLISARERYIEVVGKPPVDLQTPPPLPNLPATPDAAVAVALDNNPDLAAARERTRASGYDVKVASASRLPRVQVFSGGSYTNYFGSLGGAASSAFAQSGSGVTAGVQLNVPLFQGGRPAAQRRQAQDREAAAMEAEIGTERDIIAQVRSAFAAWRASNETIASNQTAVDAAALSLEGVRAENSVGNRTILDILNAEQDLLNTQVRLVTARRNAYVAGFTLIAAMGYAQARDLGLDGGALYDPNVNYQRVRHKIWDWSNDPAPTPKSTRTVDTPAQNGAIPPSAVAPVPGV